MTHVASRLQANWKSGLTVALVNIPLSVSLAVAAHSTPTAGIITAVWAGLIAALIGGSDFNIFGPAGALSGILAAYAIAHGAASLPVLAMASGVLILIAFAARLERFLIFVPGNAIQGFTLSVALVIGLSQFNYAFGLTHLPPHGAFLDNLEESLRHFSEISTPTTIVFALSLIFLFLLLRMLPRVPGAIVLTVGGIALGFFSSRGALPFRIQTLADKFGDLSATLVQPPHFAWTRDLPITALSVAIVAILETMLSAKVADGMTKTRYDERREMLGLSLANIAAGLVGGLPSTAVLARTALNVKSGATHKMSAGINAVFVAFISLLFLGYFKYIPMAVIAAILAFVAMRMVEVEFFVHAWKRDRPNFWMALVVAFICVYMDPLYGILTGTVVALLLFVHHVSQGHFELWLHSRADGEVGHISGTQLEKISAESDILTYGISGQMAYLNSRAHLSRFEGGFGKHDHVILRLRELKFVDRDGVDALDEIIELCRRSEKDVVVSGPNPEIDLELEQGSQAYRSLKAQGLVFPGSAEALAHFGYDPIKHSLRSGALSDDDSQPSTSLLPHRRA